MKKRNRISSSDEEEDNPTPTTSDDLPTVSNSVPSVEDESSKDAVSPRILDNDQDDVSGVQDDTEMDEVDSAAGAGIRTVPDGSDTVNDSDKENVAPPRDEVDGCGVDRAPPVVSSDEEAETTLVALHPGNTERSPLQELSTKPKGIFDNDDLFDQDDSSDSCTPTSSTKKKVLSKKKKKSPRKSDDDSDNEKGRSQDERQSGSDRSGSDSEQKSNSDSDASKKSEESDDEQRPKMGRWSSGKGAAKKPEKGPRKKRTPKKDRRSELNEIHSESQRLVRESSTNLPYWKPQPLNLKDILNKQKQRKETLSLKPSAAEIARFKMEEELRKEKEADNKRKRAIDKKFGIEDILPTNTEEKCETWVAQADSHILPDLTSSKQEVHVSNMEVGSSEVEVGKALISDDDDDDSLPALNIVIEGKKDDDPDSGHDSQAVSQKLEQMETEIDGFTKLKPMDESKITDDLPEMTSFNNKVTSVDVVKNDVRTSKQPKLSLPAELTSFTPKLVCDQGFVDLDSGDEDRSGMDDLKSRFIKQLKKTSPGAKPKAQKIDISYVHKEKIGDTEELKLSHVTYTPDAEDKPEVGSKPGAKLASLKQKLRADLERQRAEARKKKLQLQELDKEEEAELTDQSESEEEEEEEQTEEMENQQKSEFVDEAAVDEDDDEAGSEDDGPGDADGNDSGSGDEDEMKLELSDDDDLPSMNLNQESSSSLMKSTSRGTDQDEESHDVSRDSGENGLTSSLNVSTQDMFTPFSKAQQKNKFSSQALHLELGDTQDLLKIDDDVITSPKLDLSLDDTQSLLLDENGFLKSTCAMKPVGDTNRAPRALGQLLKGVARGGPDRDSERGPALNLLMDSSASQDNMDDLAGLCTGAFGTEPEKVKGLFDETQGDELAMLCTGKFATQNSQAAGGSSLMAPTQDGEMFAMCSGGFKTQPSQAAGGSSLMDPTQDGEMFAMCSGGFKTQTQSSLIPPDENANQGLSPTPSDVIPGGDDVTDDEDDGIMVASGDSLDDRPKKRKKVSRVFSDDEGSDGEEGEEIDQGEGEEGGESDEEEEDGEELEDGASDQDGEESELDSDDERNLIAAKTLKKKKVRGEFVDLEAELSGSEAGSDENEEGGEDQDVMETELGDLDDVGTEDQLRSQVGKVHLKSLMDADKRELKLYQEMFLADGDLHSDKGRERKFRWKNIDENFNFGNHGNESDDENHHGDEDETELEIRRRKERFERERWLTEQAASQQQDEDESESQIMKKVVLKRANSAPAPAAPPTLKTDITPKSIFKSASQRHGSFLRKSNVALAQIAEMTKTGGGSGHSGQTSSRNFVFSALSPDDRKRKQHEGAASSQAAKRSKVDSKTKQNKAQPTSIFKLMG